MNLNNIVQIDKDCYSIKQKNDLKDLNYIVNTGSHVHCLEDDNTYVYLGENRWGLIENKDSGSSEGSDLITETLQVTANGIYEAPEGKAYNQVEVEVPNGRLDYIVSWDDSAYDIGNNSVAITSYYPANSVDDILNPVLRLITVDNNVYTYNLTVSASSSANGDLAFVLNEDPVAILHHDFEVLPSFSHYGSALSCATLSSLVSETVTGASIRWHRFGEIDVSRTIINSSGIIDVSIKTGRQQTIWYANAYTAPDYAYLDTFDFPNPLDASTTVPIYRYSERDLQSFQSVLFIVGDPIDMLNDSNLPLYTSIDAITPSDVDSSLDYLDGLCFVVRMINDSGEGPSRVPIGLSVHTADQLNFNNTGLYLISPNMLITMIRSLPGFDPTDQSSTLVMMVNALQQFGYSVATIELVSPDEQTFNDAFGASIMYQGILPDMIDGQYLCNTTVFDTTIKREDVPQATAYSLQASENPVSAGLDSIRFRVPEAGNVTFYRYSDWYTSSLEEAEQHGFKILGAYVIGEDPSNDGASQVEYPLTLIKPSDAGISSALDPYLLGITAIVNNNTIPIGVIMFERYEDLDGNIFKKGIYLMAPEALNSMGMFGSGDYEINMIRTGQPGEIAADSQVALTSYYYVHDILGDSHFTGYMSPMDISFPKPHFIAADEGKVVNNGALVAQVAHATVTQNGTIDTTLNNSITVNVPSSSNSSAPMKDVNFYDYDGTITNSYTAAEFAELTAMPDNPSHNGLTAQGWNWSLSDAQTYVAKYGELIIGQMYITDDGKTRIYIHLEEGRLAPYLGIAPAGTVVINWGDGSNPDTLDGSSTITVITTQHIYTAAGDYVITIDASSAQELGIIGDSGLGAIIMYKSVDGTPNRVYQNAIQKVEIGSKVTQIGSYAFCYCSSLESVTLPVSVSAIKDYAFNNCYSLKSVTLPANVAGVAERTFSSCNSLMTVALPNSVSTMGNYAFNSCNSLERISIPDHFITLGSNCFAYNYNLESIKIPAETISQSAFLACNDLVSVTIGNKAGSIGANAFTGCNGCAFVRFESTTPPPAVSSSTFAGFPNDCIIYVPSGTLAAYTNATNYPSSSTYTYIEY